MIKRKELTGRRFEKLTVLGYSHNTGGAAYWDCICDCGNKKKVKGSALIQGRTKSCGCIIKDIATKRIIDLTGKQFGRLKVIEFAEIRVKQVYWLCRCECGNSTITRGSSLKSGHTQSCGCLGYETKVTNALSHGMSSNRKNGYGIWAGMKDRCSNPKNSHFKYYGGRDIKVCDRWLHSFENFLEDMGERPEGYSIDRIDNDKGYYKENCRWATIEQQSVNKRTTILLTHNDKTQSMSEWARDLNMSKSVLRNKIKKGFTLDEIIDELQREKLKQKDNVVV